MNDYELMYFEPEDRKILKKVSSKNHSLTEEEKSYLLKRNLLLRIEDGFYLVKNPLEYHCLTALYPVLEKVTVQEVSEVLTCLYNGYFWDYNYVRRTKKDLLSSND